MTGTYVLESIRECSEALILDSLAEKLETREFSRGSCDPLRETQER